MAPATCLITGGSGQLGRDLVQLLPGSVVLAHGELDITDLGAVVAAVTDARPALVFNCAAFNAVDRAEAEPATAFAVNATGARNVARACRRSGSKLVHFSTNYVFDGGAAEPYTEDDEPRPISAYGRSKLEGELAVQEEAAGVLIIRSSGLFGAGGSAIKGGSFPDRIVARARSGEPLAVVDDQRLNPTYTGHLAAAAIAAVGGGLTGILHLVAAGCCSYREFAVEILRLAELSVPVTPTETKPGGARRPANGCLASVRAAALPNWRQGLLDYWRAGSAATA